MITYVLLIALMHMPALCMNTVPHVVCESAQHSDLPGILRLYEKAVINNTDTEKIVILPEHIREESIRSAICKKRLFVARINDTVVAFKKNYIVNDPSELQEILMHEFRFTENKIVSYRDMLIDQNKISTSDFVEKKYHFVSGSIYIYTGSDYTDPDYRGKGINTELSLNALASVVDKTNFDTITLIFGLTESNAECVPDKDHKDRVPSIAKAFAHTLKKCYGIVAPVKFTHTKTKAYMPHFTYENGNLIISSDEKSTAGFGNMLTYKYSKKNTSSQHEIVSQDSIQGRNND